MEKIIVNFATGFFILAFMLFFFWILRSFWWMARVDKKSEALSKILKGKECVSKSDGKRYLIKAVLPLSGCVFAQEVGFGAKMDIKLSLKEITFSYLPKEARDLFKFFYHPDILRLYGISR